MHTHSLARAHAHTLTRTHTFTHTHSRSHTHRHSHTLGLTHTLTHTHGVRTGTITHATQRARRRRRPGRGTHSQPAVPSSLLEESRGMNRSRNLLPKGPGASCREWPGSRGAWGSGCTHAPRPAPHLTLIHELVFGFMNHSGVSKTQTSGVDCISTEIGSCRPRWPRAALHAQRHASAGATGSTRHGRAGWREGLPRRAPLFITTHGQ